MLNIFLKTTKSCFPRPQIFHASNLWTVGALGSVTCIHKGKDGFPAWWCDMQASQPDCLASQSRKGNTTQLESGMM